MSIRVEHFPVIREQPENGGLNRSSLWSYEKVRRFSLYFFSFLSNFFMTCVSLSVCNGASIWYLLSLVPLALVGTKLKEKGEQIHDFNDSREVEKLRKELSKQTASEMLQKFDLSTICTHNLVPPDVFRFCVCAELRYPIHSSIFEIFVQNADALLAHRMITVEMRSALIQGNQQKLCQLIPSYREPIDRMFPRV